MKFYVDAKWVGHPGIHCMVALVEHCYYWSHLCDNVEAFENTCLACQQDKLKLWLSIGLLEPLLVPECSQESVPMDFIINLPKFEGCWTLMVVVDWFSKCTTFVPAMKDYPAEEPVRLACCQVLGSTTDDHERLRSLFHCEIWTELFVRSDLNFSTSLPP